MSGFPVIAIGIVVGTLAAALLRSFLAPAQVPDKMLTLGISQRLDALLKHAGISFRPYGDLPDPVQEAIRGGRKLEAIRLYREYAGVGLRQGKDFIEDLMSQERQCRMKLDALLNNAGIALEPYAGVPGPVLEAIRSGRKIEAIKLYREATGAGLKEAKAQVEEIERNPAP